MGRLGFAALAAGCLGLLLVGATLAPDPRGFGTHTGLGLERCGFLLQSSLPCPSCGMTTSVAWFARGNLAASLWVQPMGTVIAAAAATFVWIGLYAAVTGVAVHRWGRLLPLRYWLLPLLSLVVLAWAWKIFLQLQGLDGWA